MGQLQTCCTDTGSEASVGEVTGLGADVALVPTGTLKEAAEDDMKVRETVSEGSPLRGKRGSQNGDGSPREDTQEDACVLVWMLGEQGEPKLTAALPSFHQYLQACTEVTMGVSLFIEAWAGGIRGLGGMDMTPSDSMMRLGQLLCRWGSMNRISIKVGVHVGKLHKICVGAGANQKATFFGTAVAHAFHLASTVTKAYHVHLSPGVKDSLGAFRLTKLIVSPRTSSFYLDPLTKVKNLYDPKYKLEDATEAEEFAPEIDKLKSMTISIGVGDRDRETMTMSEFGLYLTKHGVNIAAFGKGPAKTLTEFYEAVVKDKRSHLEVVNGKLLRTVSLVRISLRIRDGANKLRELRIAAQATAQGEMRKRDQPFAVVLTPEEENNWQDAINKCFASTLCLPSQVQRACFATDMESYYYKENQSNSDTIPGIATVYKAHNIIVNIKDKTDKNLKSIGLPEGSNFTTGQGSAKSSWSWAPVENNQEDELRNLLQKFGIDVSDFPAQSFAELYDEVYDRCLCTLEVQNDELLRTIRIIKVFLHAQVLNVDHVLVVKAKWQRGQFDTASTDKALSMRMSPDQGTSEAAEQLLKSRLGLSEAFQRKYLAFDPSSISVTQEINISKSYPGLKTAYIVNQMTVRVVDSEAPACHLLGLPAGTDFTFSRSQMLAKGPDAEDLVVTHFNWRSEDQVADDLEIRARMSIQHKPSVSDLSDADDFAMHPLASRVVTGDDMLKRRVRKPKLLSGSSVQGHPAGKLAGMMKGQKTDWKRAENAAKRILDPKYTAKDFLADITAAFPELRLYCTNAAENVAAMLASSGRTLDDEYQRTVGALFAVFWTYRLALDGKDSFCFGLDEQWLALSPGADVWRDASKRDVGELTKRKVFKENMDWQGLTKLLVDAGLLSASGGHDVQRTLAMLVMMAIHDIMKVTDLLPVVDAAHGGFGGYASGETINDHDVALSYILVHYPSLLPSYAGLPKRQQESIRFAHCKMEYNMGWLVQAEAPPGALFKTFRNVVVSGAAKDSDVAFYFVHWFADLAGAEPYPLDGCNKFVLKFPQHVLGQFLASFSIVQDIAVHPETRVLEEYYKSCWEKNAEGRPLPAGPGSIAQMRLVLMAQGDSKVIIDEYNKLSFVDKKVLNNEMACTGCAGQQFQCDPLTGQETAGKGPAILVYYGPALLQKPGRDNPRGALVILTEIYRKTRELFPLSAQDVGNSVTVRIDAAKDLECDSVLRPVSGQYWVVSRSSNKDAMLKSLSASELKDVDWSKNVVLSFDKAVRTPNAPKGGGEFGTASVGLASTGSTPWTGIGARVRRMSLFGGSYLPGSWSPSSREE